MKPIFSLLDLAVRPDRQFRRRDHRPDPHRPAAAVPDRAEAVRLDGEDAGRPAEDEGAPGPLQGRQAELQQEMMKLYQEEKVNPMAGCLPILLQIPIFYALYKVLLVSVEMRHEPFALWIHDLVRARSADPGQPVRLSAASRRRRSSRSACCRSCVGITMWLQMQAQPAGARSGAAADLRADALGADVRDGAVRGRPAALLGDQQPPLDRPAAAPLRPPSGAEARRWPAVELRPRRRRRRRRRRPPPAPPPARRGKQRPRAR